MKNRWKSYVYVPALACVLAISGMFLYHQKVSDNISSREQIYNLDEYFNENTINGAEAQAVDEKNVVLEDVPKVITEKEAEFVLRMVDDYVVVYRNGKTDEHYMTTGIEIKELPIETQKEIIDGKEIADEEALYFFLESHSS